MGNIEENECNRVLKFHWRTPQETVYGRAKMMYVEWSISTEVISFARKIHYDPTPTYLQCAVKLLQKLRVESYF